MWLNTNFLVLNGLRKLAERYDVDESHLQANPMQVAHDIEHQMLGVVQKCYEHFGCIFEFYDSMDHKPPTVLPRKHHRHSGSIRDYHWSSAITFYLLNNT